MAVSTDATHNPVEFLEGGASGASIWLSPSVIAAMLEAAIKAGRCETGGILIGRYGPDAWQADVIEATPKPKGSRSGWFWFQRSNTGLAALLEKRWSAGHHYLGEWHFHPGAAPTPSGPDIRAMQKIARDEVYRCPSPLLVILGGKPKTAWSISATLFRDGVHVPLRQRP